MIPINKNEQKMNNKNKQPAVDYDSGGVPYLLESDRDRGARSRHRRSVQRSRLPALHRYYIHKEILKDQPTFSS